MYKPDTIKQCHSEIARLTRENEDFRKDAKRQREKREDLQADYDRQSKLLDRALSLSKTVIVKPANIHGIAPFVSKK